MEIKYDDKDKLIDDNKVSNKYYENEKLFDKNIRTKFRISFLFLVLEVMIPSLIVWLLTGNDFLFSFKMHIYIVIILLISTIIFSFLLTMLFYFLKFHKSDQFTYSISLVLTLMALYISGFWWNDELMYRILLSFAVLFIGVVLGTIISVCFYNLELKKEYKSDDIAENS